MTSSRAGSEHLGADLGGVQVVVDEGIDDGGQLGLHDEIAGVFKVRDQLSESMADLLNEIDNLLLGGVARDEVVEVRHDVHADAAGELILGSD